MCQTTSSFYDYLTDKYNILYNDKYKNKKINLDKYKFKYVNVNDYCVEHNLDNLFRSTYNIIEHDVAFSYFYINHWSDNRIKIEEFYIEEAKSGNLVIWKADMQSNIIEGTHKTYTNFVYFIDNIINKLNENDVIDSEHILFSGLFQQE
jgi:hypothetical protein